jgi:hypothetical protein
MTVPSVAALTAAYSVSGTFAPTPPGTSKGDSAQ